MRSNRERWLKLAVVLLLLFNIISFVTIAVKSHRASAVSEESILLEPGVPPLNRATIRERLHFKDKQLDSFTVSSRQFRREANQIMAALDHSKRELGIALYSSTPDTVRAMEMANEIGRLHTKLKEITIELYLKLDGLSDNDQREQLQQLFEPLFRENFQTGRGGGYGRGRGRGERTGRGGRVDN